MVDADAPGLFAIFFLSIYTIVLIPYTIYRLCHAGAEDKQVVRPWAQGSRSKGGSNKSLQRLRKPSNLLLIGLWAFFAFLIYYVQVTQSESQIFDPYVILELEKGAGDREVKRAYRQLSLKYHPDKNPDPAAAKYFAEFVTKAYKALSDPVARKNYEEHGHPDGPQSISMGIALPAWLLDGSSKNAPILLAGLVFFAILLPLCVVSCYLLNSNKFAGPNGLMPETIDMFLRSQMGIREAQGLNRIMETLTVAMEYITMPTLNEQLPALEQLRKDTLRAHPDLKEKKAFWARKPSCIKASMLLLAHLEREIVQPILRKDLQFVLKKAPPLTEQIVQLACLPRPPHGYGWLSPAVGAIEYLQHLIQAVPLSARKNPGSYKPVVDGPAPLLQLPHMDAELIRKLQRKRVRTLADMQALSAADRHDILKWASLSPEQIEDVETSLSSIPNLNVKASIMIDDEVDPEVHVHDTVTCRAEILLSRPSHATQELGKDGRGVAVFAPHWPQPREEKWWLFVADPNTNEVLSPPQHISLLEAEYKAAELAKARKSKHAAVENGGSAEQAAVEAAEGSSKQSRGQVVDVMFMPRVASTKKELALVIMCDSWIGVDGIIPIRLKVSEQTRAEREGRAPRGGRVVALDEFGNPEEPYEAQSEGEEAEVSDEEYDEYDSEDSGTEESGSESEEEHGKGDDDSDASDSERSSAENLRGIVPKHATLAAEK